MPSNGTKNGSHLIGRFTEAALLKKAKEVVAEKSNASIIFDEEAERDMPRFKKTGMRVLMCVIDIDFIGIYILLIHGLHSNHNEHSYT